MQIHARDVLSELARKCAKDTFGKDLAAVSCKGRVSVRTADALAGHQLFQQTANKASA